MKSDRLTGLVVAASCLLVWCVLLPLYAEGTEQQIFPKAVLTMLMLTSAWMVFKPHPDKPRAAQSNEAVRARRRAGLKTAFMGACYLGYLLLIPVLGFFVSSLFATIFFLYFLGVRKPVLLIGVPSGMLLVIYLVIECGLRFTMPRGMLL